LSRGLGNEDGILPAVQDPEQRSAIRMGPQVNDRALGRVLTLTGGEVADVVNGRHDLDGGIGSLHLAALQCVEHGHDRSP